MRKFNICKNWNTVIYGFHIPFNAAYGKYNGVCYAVTSLSWYKDKGVLEVHLYEGGRWKTRLLNNTLTDFIKSEIEKVGLCDTQVTYPLEYQGTFQSYNPTGKKQKAASLKEANKRHWARADHNDLYWSAAGELEFQDYMTKNIVYC